MTTCFFIMGLFRTNWDFFWNWDCSPFSKTSFYEENWPNRDKKAYPLIGPAHATQAAPHAQSRRAESQTGLTRQRESSAAGNVARSWERREREVIDLQWRLCD